MTVNQDELRTQEEIKEECEQACEAEDAKAAEPASEADEAKAAEPASGADEAKAAEENEAGADESSAEEAADAEASKAEEEANAKLLRMMADFQNYKRRVEKEKKDLYSYANEKIVTDLLEVMDNFERALEQDTADGFKEGMEMIFKQLGTVLEKSGLAEIPALGEDFDPNVHNAVMTEETDEYESGKVSGVMQKGYTLNGKVIRPSMVKVVN